MKQIYTLLIILISLNLMAQDRYLDADFSVEVETNVVYGVNTSVLTGTPAPLDLKMDIYTPAGDTETNRPVMLVAHTGSFLPPLFNGGITGARSDSSTVNLCKELAARGYVAIAFTYRQGWLPTSDDQNIRTKTLLQAAYRGIQDARSCVRFLRKTAAEDGNPYGIDPSKIGMAGVGTGSYLVYGAGSLDDFGDVLLSKFIDTDTALPFIDSTYFGNIYGTTDAILCMANTPDYSSDIDFAFSCGGALGDESWIDGGDSEPAFAGVHCVQDIFAPFGDGPVIVPTTMQFVLNVSGNRTAIEKANTSGNNDILNDDSVILSFTDEIEAQKNITTKYALGGDLEITMGEDHFYAFNLPYPQGSPWAWWDLATLEAVVAGTNAALGTEFDAAVLNANGLATNPDMSAEKGHAYIDTIISFMTPRACLALDLGCNLPVDIKEITNLEIGLKVFPNPVADKFTISVDSDVKMEKIYIYSIEGKLVQAHVSVNSSNFSVTRNNLQSGIYIARITTDKGIVTKEIVFN